MQRVQNVSIPLIPNYIIVDTRPVHISNFTEDELKEIAAEWTKNLIEKSKQEYIENVDFTSNSDRKI